MDVGEAAMGVGEAPWVWDRHLVPMASRTSVGNKDAVDR